MTPLHVGVRRSANCGWYRGSRSFVPLCGRKGFFFCLCGADQFVNYEKGDFRRMKEQLEKIRSEALAALNEAKDSAELDALRVRFLGKKGELTAVLKMMGKLSAEERPVMGQAANNVRAAIEEKLEETKTALKARALDARLGAEAIEVRLLPKGSAAPGSTSGAFKDKDAKANTVQKSNEPIMGSSKTTVKKMTSAFAASGKAYPGDLYAEKGATTIEEFAKIVYEEASAEGVRPEVVFAQAMHETGWLQFGGSVKVEQCNFAGLGAVDQATGGASFESVRIGIRAQIQHLKAYASKDSLVNACVDPRFNYVRRGSAPNLVDLNGKWAVPGTGYGEAIGKIVEAVCK